MKNQIQFDEATKAEIFAFAEAIQSQEMAHGMQIDRDLQCLYRLAQGDDQEERFRPSLEVRNKIHAWKAKAVRPVDL